MSLHEHRPPGAHSGDQSPPAATLSDNERADVEQRTAPRALVVHEAIREEGEMELRRPMSALFWSALAAGLSMGFSLVAEGLLRAHLPDVSWRPLISKLGYSVGFVIVILGRQQLFTENTLTVVLPLLARPTFVVLGPVVRLWLIVLIMNLVGATILRRYHIFPPEIRQAFGEISAEALSGGPILIFLRAIFAGWLIAMMVWLLPGAEAARVWVIIGMTYWVALGGFSHIIAGSVDVLYAVTAGDETWLVIS